MILSPAALDAVFATGDEIASERQEADARALPAAEYWAVRNEAPARGSDFPPEPDEHPEPPSWR